MFCLQLTRFKKEHCEIKKGMKEKRKEKKKKPSLVKLINAETSSKESEEKHIGQQ